jgi:hypothetical protein
MLTFLRKLLDLMSAGPVDMFTAGREFAKSRLEEGTSVETLESVAANANDFDDFDRGILSVVHERAETLDD